MRRFLLIVFICLLASPSLAVRTKTNIFNVGTVPLTTGTLVTVPATGGATADGYDFVTITVGLSTAQKTAVGNTLHLEADVSTDGGTTFVFVSSIEWTSYGPLGRTIAGPDGTSIVNPDPTLNIPLNGAPHAVYRLQYQTNNLLTATPVISGTKL